MLTLGTPHGSGPFNEAEHPKMMMASPCLEARPLRGGSSTVPNHRMLQLRPQAQAIVSCRIGLSGHVVWTPLARLFATEKLLVD